MSSPSFPHADLLSWVCSLTSVLSVYFTPRRQLLGPIFGIIGIVPWTMLAVVSRQWGLMPVNIIITVLHLRTVLLWKHDPSGRK
jgi:hypothetical protein